MILPVAMDRKTIATSFPRPIGGEKGDRPMEEMHITGVGPIVTEPASGSEAGGISIEVLTMEGQESLVMSGVVAMALAAAIVKHLRQEQSLSAGETPSKE
jgi:hypothetical protein